MMNKKTQLLKNALGANAYWQVNKHLAKTIGHLPTLLLSHLIDLVTNYEEMPEEFYQQSTRLEKTLDLSKYQIQECVKTLKEKELIQVELKGIPAKNHYTLCVDNILNAMVGPETSSKKIEQLEAKNLTDKYREKETDKKDTSSAVAGKDLFTDQSQASEHLVSSLANWDTLTSIWVTEESSAILKSIFKKYFLPLGVEEQNNILEMVKSFGSDVQYLKNTWIGKTFKEGLMNREALTQDIKKRKSFGKSKSGMLTQDNF